MRVSAKFASAYRRVNGSHFQHSQATDYKARALGEHLACCSLASR